MNIEARFVQKAIKDKNYISFLYDNTKYTNIKAKSLINNKLICHDKEFDFDKVKNIQILKQRY